MATEAWQILPLFMTSEMPLPIIAPKCSEQFEREFLFCSNATATLGAAIVPSSKFVFWSFHLPKRNVLSVIILFLFVFLPCLCQKLCV